MSSWRTSALLVCMLAAGLVACSSGDRGIVVNDSWIRPAPPGASMLAGYCEIINQGNTERIITGVESAQFAGISLHETIVHEGVASMRPVAALRLPAGGTVSLRPGGLHLMLMQPTADFQSSRTAMVRFLFADSTVLEHRFNMVNPR